tara:strand:+ start:118 stop:369 length:252 start_codon:yes stop_codon:yes gene_type:complete
MKKSVNGVIMDMTSEEIEARKAEEDHYEKVTRVEKEKVRYRFKRQNSYPDIGDQLDDLFKQGAFSKEMSDKLQQVKTDHPKPE